MFRSSACSNCTLSSSKCTRRYGLHTGILAPSKLLFLCADVCVCVHACALAYPPTMCTCTYLQKPQEDTRWLIFQGRISHWTPAGWFVHLDGQGIPGTCVFPPSPAPRLYVQTFPGFFLGHWGSSAKSSACEVKPSTDWIHVPSSRTWIPISL